MAPIMIESAAQFRDDDEVLTRDPLADSDWDDRLKRCSNASFYHSAAWARVLHETYGFRPFYLTLGHSGACRAVLPVMEVRSGWTGTRGVSLPFTDDCEPCCEDPSAFQRLFRHAQRLGRERGWRYLECRGTEKLLPDTLPSLRYYGHRVDLSGNEDTLFRRFDGAVRRAIRKAERSGLRVELSDSPQAVRDFYRLFCVTRKRHGLPPQPREFYDNIRKHVLLRGLGTILLVRHGQTAVAGVLFLHGPGTVIMKFAASDLSFQHLRINNLALWQAMKHYQRLGYTSLDFGRTSITNGGLRNFKRRWGAAEHPINYHRFDIRKSTFVSSEDATNSSTLVLFQHLPVAVSQLAGRILYRHMA